MTRRVHPVLSAALAAAAIGVLASLASRAQDARGRFEYRAERAPRPGTLWIYEKSNRDGSDPAIVEVFVASPTRLEAHKIERGSRNTALVVAEMDWTTCSPERIEGWNHRADGSLSLTAVFEADADHSELSVRVNPLGGVVSRTALSCVPCHPYDFELLSLAFALPHLRRPELGFEVGGSARNAAYDPQRDPRLMVDTGVTRFDLVGREARGDRPCIRYAMRNARVDHGDAFLIMDADTGEMLTLESEVATNPRWQTFRLELLDTETIDTDAWAARVRRRRAENLGRTPASGGAVASAPDPAAPPFGIYRGADGSERIVAPWHIGSDRHTVLLETATGRFRGLTRDESSAGSWRYGPSLFVPTPAAGEVETSRDRANGTPRTVTIREGSESWTGRRLPLRAHPLRVRAGDVELAGTLTLPAHRPPRAIILCLHGSGPLDRHSFGPFPHFFVARGFGVVTYDKRGNGESSGDHRGMPFADGLARDARAVVDAVADHPRVGGARIGLFGISQGGMLALLAANHRPDAVRFMINLGGNMAPTAEQELHDRRSTLELADFSEEQVEAAMEVNRAAVRWIVDGTGYDRYVALRRAARGRPWLPRTLQVRDVRAGPLHDLAFVPERHLRNLAIPLLTLFGEKDTSTPVPASVRVLENAGLADHTLRVWPAHNHVVLGPSRTGDLRELPRLEGYPPDLFSTIASWLAKR